MIQIIKVRKFYKKKPVIIYNWLLGLQHEDCYGLVAGAVLLLATSAITAVLPDD